MINSCQKEILTKTFPQENKETATPLKNMSLQGVCGEAKSVDFLAGQNIVAGKITISNSVDKLYVTYETTGGWVIGKTHLYVGTLSGLPVNRAGNPVVGQFPYSNSFSPYVSTYTYEFDLASFSDCFIVAAHAEVHLLNQSGGVVQSETAWSAGTRINTKGNWASYVSYCKQVCQTCTYETITSTLFGGQTIPVGTLQVTNDADSLYVTYNTTNDWYLDETHLYVGDFANLPVNNANTPIPGHFPYNTDHTGLITSFTYAIPLNSLSSSCYIIASHAGVYKSVNGVIIQSETAWGFSTPFPNTNRWGWYSNYCTQICP